MRLTWRECVLLAAFAFVCIWCANALRNSNTITRVGLTHAVVTERALNIDTVAPSTIDKALWRGHYYCDKSPGISLLCIPAVWAAERLADIAGAPATFEVEAAPRDNLRYAISAMACLCATTILFSVIGLAAFMRGLRHEGVSENVAIGVALLLAFGTPWLIWSTAIFGHVTAAALLVTGFVQGCGASEPLSARRYALAGFLLAMAMLVDLTAAPAGLVIALFLLTRHGGVTAVRLAGRAWPMVAGALPVAVVLMIYNQLAFGSPFHLGYASVDGFTGMKRGFFGVSAPSPQVLWEITFGARRGLFQLSPVLLVGMLAIAMLARRPAWRPIAMTCGVIVLYYLLLNGGYYYWDGGYSLGPRHLTPMVPFLMFPLAIWLATAGRLERWVTAALGAASVLIVTVATVVSFRIPDDRTTMWADHILPGLRDGHSDLVLGMLGLPAWLLLAVPLLVIGATVGLLFYRADRADRGLPTAA